MPIILDAVVDTPHATQLLYLYIIFYSPRQQVLYYMPFKIWINYLTFTTKILKDFKMKPITSTISLFTFIKKKKDI